MPIRCPNCKTSEHSCVEKSQSLLPTSQGVPASTSKVNNFANTAHQQYPRKTHAKGSMKAQPMVKTNGQTYVPEHETGLQGHMQAEADSVEDCDV